MAMDFTLTTEQQQVKDTCRELAEEFAKRAPEADRERRIPMQNFHDMRDAGLYGVALPKELGGLGVGQVGWLAAAEELAQGDGSTALGFNMHVNATGGISQRAEIPDDVKERVADLAVEQGKLMCTSVSEPTSSSLLPASFNQSLQARRADGGYELHGRKMFASIYEAADYCYLYGHPEHEENKSASVGVLVDTNQDGITVKDVWHTLGMRATRSNQVDYDGAFVPDEYVLYHTDSFQEAFIIREANYAWGGFAMCYLGVGLGIVAWVKNFLANQQSKGYAQVNGYDPDNSRRVGLMDTEIEAARFLCYRAAWESDTQGPTPSTFLWWGRAKLAVGNALQRIHSDATVATGLHALFQTHPLERMLRDSVTAAIMTPSTDALTHMVGLLTMGLDPSKAPTLPLAD